MAFKIPQEPEGNKPEAMPVKKEEKKESLPEFKPITSGNNIDYQKKDNEYKEEHAKQGFFTLIKQNKKNLYIIAGILIVIIGSITFALWPKNGNEQSQLTEEQAIQSILPDSGGPLLADFRNGDMGNLSYNQFKQTMKVNNPYGGDEKEYLFYFGFVVIAYKDDTSNIFYSQYNSIGDAEYIMPTMGFKVKSVQANDSSLDQFKNNAVFIADEEENDGNTWHFMICTYKYKGSDMLIGNTVLPLNDNPSPVLETYQDGGGYDPKWLRLYPEFIESCEEQGFGDITDSFYDTFRVNATYNCPALNDNANDIILRPTISAIYPINYSPKDYFPKTVDEMNEWLSERGNQTLTWAVKNNSFAQYYIY